MRECGGCTICCKVPRINEPYFRKAPNALCYFCTSGKGCNIYNMRPKVCREFRCLWLDSDLPDDLRPDRIGCYVTVEGQVAKIMIDRETWKESELIELLRDRFHVLICADNHLSFVPGKNLKSPEKIIVEWTL